MNFPSLNRAIYFGRDYAVCIDTILLVKIKIHLS
jgi:hypothetical protein